ncbi:MAG: hypothetical protein ACREEE_14100, partial [Dongiaceae bacterium]
MLGAAVPRTKSQGEVTPTVGFDHGRVRTERKIAANHGCALTGDEIDQGGEALLAGDARARKLSRRNA